MAAQPTPAAGLKHGLPLADNPRVKAFHASGFALGRGVATCGLALMLAVAPTPARAWDWPHLGLYGSIYGVGYPLWDMGGTLDPTVLDQIARYHEVILDVGPITPYRPDALAALRARRPDISLLAYVLGQTIWDSNDPDSLVHIPTRVNHMIRNMDGYLYNTRGTQFYGANIDLAKRGVGGRLVVAEALADLFNDAILKTGMWDGIFIDVYCNSIVWMQTPSENIDFRRSGYATLAEFDLAWQAGTDTLANRLRRYGGSNLVLIGNCASGTKYASCNGWMRENFPFQQGGTWFSNMSLDPGGYVVDEARFRAPTHNYIFSAVVGGASPYSATNTQKVRFGLATAALGNGFGVFGPSDRRPTPYPYFSWWYDEYAVNLATGSASNDIRDTGWLGQPLSDSRQMIWVGSAPDAVGNPDFETDVTSGWLYFAGVTAPLERDVTTAAVGSASAHMTITTTSPWAYSISFASAGSVTMSAGLQYSATFWAKAAVPRTIRVAAAHVGPGEFVSNAVTLGTTWQQYQVTFVPAVSGDARLQFQVGGEAGDVWVDDCHFQAGTSSLYRRDFQNGIVLINPGDVALTVPLERDFKKIAGLVDPAFNDGARVTQVTIGPSDALFLIGTDRISPRDITDLRRIP